jgi:pyruvate/2-oxoglutarate dehydrogenase complex dihydrolipoamide acyltransferase (E2) component
MYDHRVLDGSNVARILERLEEALTGPILDELRGLAKG